MVLMAWLEWCNIALWVTFPAFLLPGVLRRSIVVWPYQKIEEVFRHSEIRLSVGIFDSLTHKYHLLSFWKYRSKYWALRVEFCHYLHMPLWDAVPGTVDNDWLNVMRNLDNLCRPVLLDRLEIKLPGLVQNYIWAFTDWKLACFL